MKQIFKKNDEIRSFEIDGDRVMATLEIDGVWISNPNLTDFLAEGWTEYVAPVVEPILPSVEELVEAKIRERYTINKEFQINRKRDTDKAAFDAYYEYVEECIAWAEQQPHREE